MSEYETQANDFLNETKTSLTSTYLKHDYHFGSDVEKRDIYKVTIKRGSRSYTFNFGQSIANQGKAPTNYDILACLNVYEIGTFQDFCDEFGYDGDSINALKTYEAVQEETKNLKMIWTDEELEQLQEIN